MIKKYKEFIEEGLLRHYNRWHNGEKRQEDKHEYVDLGLPSGLLWAKCNLGADTEYESGGYYAWGETEEKDKYTWGTYKFGNEYNISKYDTKDKKYVLEPEDDVVHMNWGGKWRMPTMEDFKELIKNTTYTIESNYNNYGVKGILFTGKNSNRLFIPYSGYMSIGGKRLDGKSLKIWTSSIYDYKSAYIIECIEFYSRPDFEYRNKSNGMTIRGVREK